MPYPMRPILVFATCLLLAVVSSLRAAEPPPEPVCPERTKEMTQAQFSAAHDQWRAAHNAWEANLTAGQYLAYRERKNQPSATPAENKERASFERRQRLPLPTDGYSWRNAAAQSKLGADVIATLEAHQIAFGDSVRQSFTPYRSGPVFITSDSVLNAFHVLFEDSFRELELRRAVRFRADFEQLLTTARKLPREQDILAPERIEPAIRHLERVLGPALVICGTPLEFFGDTVRSDIRTQVDLIKGAEKTELPSWLAPADPASLLALDYRRFQPVGFYTKPSRLASYFRAMRWLQLVPFRASREQEFDAMVLLSLATHERGVPTELLRNLLSRNDDPSPLILRRGLDHSFPRRRSMYDSRRPEICSWLVRQFLDDGYYQINSDERAQRTIAETFAQLTFRIVPQAAFADSVLFQQLLDHGQKPSGLAVAALLGSPFANQQLNPTAQTLVMQSRSQASLGRQARNWREPQLYDDYLYTLGALFLPPAPEAPGFMKGDTWAMKSTHTALGGWAQMRHTFTLQAKMSAMYRGLVIVPPGFVEPNPDFYSRLSHLIANCDEILASADTYLPSPALEADDLRELAEFIREKKLDRSTSREEDLQALSHEEFDRYSLAERIGFNETVNPRDGAKLTPEQFHQRQLDLVDRLEAKASRIERGQETVSTSESSLRNRWQSLARIVARLEALAHKQLRGQPWTDDEAIFLKRYGEDMAYIHGYYGNSWLTPRDDAPRWTEVSGLPERGTFLVAGVGRPRTIYVLYPWNGMEILCTGSVMQYYEYEGKQRLSDEAWRDLLDSPEAPSLPTWMQPYAKVPGKPAAEH